MERRFLECAAGWMLGVLPGRGSGAVRCGAMRCGLMKGGTDEGKGFCRRWDWFYSSGFRLYLFIYIVAICILYEYPMIPGRRSPHYLRK